MATRLQTTIRKIYLYKSLTDFILLYPLYSILFAAHGLSTFQISTLFVIWAVTDITTNIPLGVLADTLPRKWLLAAGPLVEAVGFLAWLVWPSYSGFTLGFVLWGISGAIVDGTFEAYLYDELKAGGIEQQYVRIAGRTQSFALIANFAATGLAGAAILLGYGFVIEGSIGALLLASLTALSLPNPKQYEKTREQHYISMLKAGFLEAFRNRVLIEIIVLGGVIGTVYGTLDEYVPLFFHQVGYNTSIVSCIVAATILVAALGSFIAHRYEHLETRSFMALLLLCGALLVLSARMLGVRSIILMLFFTFVIKMLHTIYDGRVQHEITGHLRATVTSMSFFCIETFSVVAYLLYGIASRHGGNPAGFAVMGVVAMTTALLYLFSTPGLLTRHSKQAG